MRNLELESDLLGEISKLAGQDGNGFVSVVNQRLEMGARNYELGGPAAAWYERNIASLESEIREEAADIVAWLLLAIQRSFQVEREESDARSNAAYAERRDLYLRVAASAQLIHSLLVNEDD
jgi:hypothetical protein